MNAVARLAAQCNRQTPVVPLHVCLTIADARELMQVIADTCPEHQRCPGCWSTYCVVCGIDDRPADCICSPWDTP